MAVITILVFIAMLCAGIYLIAIYALPILAGLAAYSLLKQIDASAPTIAVISIASALAALAAARAGAAARSDIVRLATLALIAAPAGYASYSATLQLSRVFNVPEEWWILLSAVAALAAAAFAIDIVGRPMTVHRRAPELDQAQPPQSEDRIKRLQRSSEAGSCRFYGHRVPVRRSHPFRSH